MSRQPGAAGDFLKPRGILGKPSLSRGRNSMADLNLLTLESRQQIADRLRHAADRIQHGEVTVDDFNLEPEWIDRPPTKDGLKIRKPSGRIFLKLAYWTTAIEQL